MIKTILPASAFLMLFVVFQACKSGKAGSSQSGTTQVTVPAQRDLFSVALIKYPGITRADLAEGKNIYTTDCVRCHSAEEVTSRDESRWKEIIDRMAKKASLSEVQKNKVLHYVLCQRALETGR